MTSESLTLSCTIWHTRHTDHHCQLDSLAWSLKDTPRSGTFCDPSHDADERRTDFQRRTLVQPDNLGQVEVDRRMQYEPYAQFARLSSQIMEAAEYDMDFNLMFWSLEDDLDEVAR
jgi:hypothetical protein